MGLLFLTCSETHGGCGSTKPGVTGETRKSRVTWMPGWSNDFYQGKAADLVKWLTRTCDQRMRYVLHVFVAQASKEETQSSEPKAVKKHKQFFIAIRQQGGSHLLPIQQIWPFYAAAELFTLGRRGTVRCKLFHRDETTERGTVSEWDPTGQRLPCITRRDAVNCWAEVEK